MDLALNNLQRLICHKTKQTNQSSSLLLSLILSLFFSFQIIFIRFSPMFFFSPFYLFTSLITLFMPISFFPSNTINLFLFPFLFILCIKYSFQFLCLTIFYQNDNNNSRILESWGQSNHIWFSYHVTRNSLFGLCNWR